MQSVAIRPLTLVTITFLLAGAVAWAAPPPDGKDPIYAGKRLSEWLTALESKSYTDRNAAQASLRRDGKKLVPALRADLKNDDERLASGAARLLGELGPDAEPAVPDLIDALKSRLAKVRANAAYALGVIGQPARAAVGPLIELLSDKDKDARREAAGALGSLREEARRAVPALRRALKDREPLVRGQAARALGHLGKTKEAIPVLIALLEDKDPKVRDWAAVVLGSFRREATGAIGPLIDLLRKDPKSSAGVQIALEMIGPQAIPRVVELARDPDAEVRKSAFFILGRIGPHGIPRLIELLKDRDVEVRTSAALALGFIGPDAKDAIAPLGRALKDPNKKVQQAAASALGYLGPTAIPVLISALQEQDESIRAAAGGALTGMGRPAIKPLAEVLRGPNKKAREQAGFALGLMGAPAVPALIAALQEKDVAVRLEAVSALRMVSSSDKDVLKSLAGALNDANEKVRHLACSALEGAGKAARPFLGRALKSRNADVRRDAAVALGAVASKGMDGEKKEIAALLVPLLDDKPEVQFFVTTAMQRIGKPAVACILPELKSNKANVRSAAARTLGQVVSKGTDQEKKELAALLVPLLSDEVEVRGSAATAMQTLGKPAVPVLIKTLKSKKAEVRSGAVMVLGSLGADAVTAIPALRTVRDEDPDPDVRALAGQTLERLHFD